jgi:hypothetical protein
MDHDDLFNSSDQEYGICATTNPWTNAGNKSIEAMCNSRYDDRRRSKKRIRTLEDTAGASGTVYKRSLWFQRFDKYREMNDMR